MKYPKKSELIHPYPAFERLISVVYKKKLVFCQSKPPRQDTDFLSFRKLAAYDRYD